MDNRRLAFRLAIAYTIPSIIGVLAVSIDLDHPICKVAPQVCRYLGSGGRPLHVMVTLLVLAAWVFVSTCDKGLAIIAWILRAIAWIAFYVWVFLVSFVTGAALVFAGYLWRMFR